MRYSITDGTLSLGGQTILSHIDFEIKGKEKIAVVGRNGAGKTTLLRLIEGSLELDRDDKRRGNGIVTDRKLTIGMMKQTGNADPETRILDLMLSFCPSDDPYSRERYLYEMEFDRIFTGFGFALADKQRKLGSFSGGEQTRIALIHLLLEKPDLLLLDEPTNHLDTSSVEWLENYLKSYEKAVIMVSHDRFFLDQTAEIVYELENGRLTRYVGNYSSYREQKKLKNEQLTRQWKRQQEELDRLNGLVEKFKNKPRKAAFARSRKSLIQRMETIEKPQEDMAHMFTGPIDPLVIGPRWVMEAQHLKIGWEEVLLELSLRVRRGQKIGIIGDNGAGKSTFLKTVYGQIPPLEGRLEIGNQVLMGYFDQQTASFTSEKQVAEHFRLLYPALPEKEVRQILAAYLFAGKEASKKVSDLSGGEKSRLFLCELMTGRPNLLLLDEPTNHMDIPACETLESAFRAYTGTMLFISHDRYFVNRVADAILVFEDAKVMYYPFGYEHYLTHCRRKDENLSALVQAENQALVADMRAVPRAMAREREISTEDAYISWRLGLARQPLEEARARYESRWELYLEEEKQYQTALWQDLLQTEERGDMQGLLQSAEGAIPRDSDSPGKSDGHREPDRPREPEESAWTAACLAWYDIWLELGL